MRRLEDWRAAPRQDRDAAAAMGNFDGLHAGHQAVIAAARRAAEAGGLKLGVIVFAPHPRRFFQPQAEPFRLMSDDTRHRLLGEMGVDVLYQIPFDRDLSLRDARAFARDVLADGLGLRHVVIGFDFRFGRDRGGDAPGLRAFGRELGFETTIVEPVEREGGKCSSTAIRTALQAGDPETAERLLTRPWIVDGLVARGDQRGRLLGFPTANVGLGPLLRPKFGVYAVAVRIDGETAWRPGVANIGRRPTFEGEDERVEAHLFDFEGDLYGRRIEVAVRRFVRPERRFDGVDALKAQIDKDAAVARDLLADAR